MCEISNNSDYYEDLDYCNIPCGLYKLVVLPNDEIYIFDNNSTKVYYHKVGTSQIVIGPSTENMLPEEIPSDLHKFRRTYVKEEHEGPVLHTPLFLKMMGVHNEDVKDL